MNIVEAVRQIDNPKRWLEGDWFSVQVVFENSETYDGYDETSFDIDCSQPNDQWRDDIVSLWNGFADENNFPRKSVVEVWATVVDEYFAALQNV